MYVSSFRLSVHYWVSHLSVYRIFCCAFQMRKNCCSSVSIIILFNLSSDFLVFVCLLFFFFFNFPVCVNTLFQIFYMYAKFVNDCWCITLLKARLDISFVSTALERVFIVNWLEVLKNIFYKLELESLLYAIVYFKFQKPSSLFLCPSC